jgi:ribose transport system substrate-binding protein
MGRRARWFAAGTTLSVVLAACAVGGANGNSGGASGSTSACGSYDKSVLDNRTIPSSLNTNVPVPLTVNNSAQALGAPQTTQPVNWANVTVTPAQVKEVCNKHLTAVFLDWSNVTYNKAIESGVRQELGALGIKLLRITDYEFNASGLAGDLSAVMALNPDIIIVGGTINPSQMSSIMAPAVAAHKIIISWADGGPGMYMGPGKQVSAMISYDFYGLGQQMAEAVHEAYPNGATIGYIHWVNDVNGILLRESGFLDGLKKYPNIHVIAAGGPPNPASANSGFNDPNGAEAYTEAFLQSHKNVNVIFAPWENPPGLGEEAAIKALHLQNKVSIVTMDLAEAGAASLSSGGSGVIKVDMAEDVYDAGRMLALTGGLAAAHLPYPDYVDIPTYPTTDNNVTTAWNFMHGPQLPCAASVCG